MGKGKYHRQAELNTKNPARILVIAGCIAAAGLFFGFKTGQWNVGLIIIGIGALYSLLYFYWKRKHDK